MPRIIFVGMNQLGYTEKEVLSMTPRKFYRIYEEYLKINGIEDNFVSMDDLP